MLGPPPGHLPNPRIEPGSPTLQADSLPSEPPGKPQSQIKVTVRKYKKKPKTDQWWLKTCVCVCYSERVDTLLINDKRP